MNNNCPNCLDHENRLKNLEKSMEEVQNYIKKSSVTVAVISFLGVVLTAMTSFFGVILTAFFKSKGII